MEHIDLRDKFFHGILIRDTISKTKIDDIRLEKLESILAHDKLYCLDNLLLNKINKGHNFISFPLEDFYNKSSQICLSVLPNISKYSHKKVDHDTFSIYTSPNMYLIFSDKILDEYSIEKGYLDNEYYLQGDLEIKKNLVGIGNAGLSPDYRLAVIYYFFKYYHNDISFDEFLMYSNTMYQTNYDSIYNLEKIENISQVIDELGLIRCSYVDKKVFYEYEVNASDYYLEKSSYYERLKKLADKHKVKLYDKNGTLIENERKKLKEIEEMIDYVLKNLYDTEEERREYQLSRLNRTRSRIR